MAKKSVKMALSITILGILLGSYYGVKLYVDKIEEKENASMKDIITAFSCNFDDIKSFSFMSNDMTELMFEKIEDTWKYVEDEMFPVKQDEVEDTLGVLTEIEADMLIEDVEDINLYELGNPTNVFTLEMSNGETTTITIGMENISTEQYYMMLNNETETVYVIDPIYVEAFGKELYDFAEGNTFPNVDTSTIQEIQIESEGAAYTLECNRATGLWYVSSELYADEKADSSNAQSIASSIGSLEYASFVNYNCEDDSEYGLDEPYAIVTVNYQEESAEEKVTAKTVTTIEEKTAEVEENEENEALQDTDDIKEETVLVDKQLVLYIGDEAGASSRYVKIEGEKEIYTMSNSTLEIFTEKDADDFLDLTVSYLSLNNLSELIVKCETGEYVINVSRETSENEDGEEETIISYRLNNQTIENDIEFTTFYNKVINMVGESRWNEKFEAEKDALISIEFKDLDDTITTVSYYEYDENYYVAIKGEKGYLVNKLNVDEMIESFETFVGDDAESGVEKEEDVLDEM